MHMYLTSVPAPKFMCVRVSYVCVSVYVRFV